ncbi:MAG: EAL domain-containing protein [Bacilli bacterium]|nr:EAL domain-containing protein [Bacilli bacterium]
MKKIKILLTELIAIAVAIVTIIFVVAYLSFAYGTDYLFVVLILFFAMAGFITLGAYVFALLYSEHKTINNLKTENEYNLNRNYVFFNYDYFTRKITLRNIKNKDLEGYMIAFNCVRNVEYNSKTLKDDISELNGCVADFLLEKIENKDRKHVKFSYFCYYHGVFLIYLDCSAEYLNELIDEIETRIYEILREKDFRLYIQPYFGIYNRRNENKEEHDIIYKVINYAMVAREIGENKFDSVTFYSDALSGNKETTEYEAIINALNRNEFIVHYQPKFSLNTKQFVSAEALVRWNSPKNGLVSPIKFISEAENGGLIHRIDMFVLEQVCKDLNEAKRKGRRMLPVSINFSIYEFYAPDFVEDIIKTINQYKVNPSLIEMEITESVSGANSFVPISIIKQLKAFGLRILMDDFGVGYSNFNNIKNMPIDVLKIDKSFIDYIVDDEKSREIVKLLIDFAKSLNLESVAEGVSSKEQVDILRRYKCDTIQGYYYSQPISRSDYEKFLANNPFEKKGVEK